MNEEKYFYSNCLLEALKAKIKGGKRIRIIHVRAKDNNKAPHWLWWDTETDMVYDFDQRYVLKSYFGYLWHVGRIRQISYSAYQRWERT